MKDLKQAYEAWKAKKGPKRAVMPEAALAYLASLGYEYRQVSPSHVTIGAFLYNPKTELVLPQKRRGFFVLLKLLEADLAKDLRPGEKIAPKKSFDDVVKDLTKKPRAKKPKKGAKA